MEKIKCSYCNDKEVLTDCKFCGKLFCTEHILPELHKCKGLKEYKNNKHPKVERLEDNPLYMSDNKELSKFRKVVRIEERRRNLNQMLEKKTELKKISFFKWVDLYIKDRLWLWKNKIILFGIILLIILILIYVSYFKINSI